MKSTCYYTCVHKWVEKTNISYMIFDFLTLKHTHTRTHTHTYSLLVIDGSITYKKKAS